MEEVANILKNSAESQPIRESPLGEHQESPLYFQPPRPTL